MTSTIPSASIQAERAVRDLLARGRLDLPQVGGGRTLDRWTALALRGQTDLPVAALALGHLEARATLSDLADVDEVASRVGTEQCLWGVWDAGEPGPDVAGHDAMNHAHGFRRDGGGALAAAHHQDGWVLGGRLSGCRGAMVCDRALVSARHRDGERLFAIRQGTPGLVVVQRAEPATASYDRPSGCGTREVIFDRVEAVPVGGVSAYRNRSGYWHATLDAAAVGWGAARGMGQVLRHAVDLADEQSAAGMGAVDATLHAAWCVLHRAAAAADGGDLDLRRAQRAALRAVAAVSGAADVTEWTTHLLIGTGSAEGEIACTERVDDLDALLHRGTGDRGLAALGALVSAQEIW